MAAWRASNAAVTPVATASELASKSLSALAKLFKKHLGTDYGRQIAEQMIRKSKTRQIDFIMVEWSTKKFVKDAGSIRNIDLGSDHAAVKISLTINNGCKGSSN